MEEDTDQSGLPGLANFNNVDVGLSFARITEFSESLAINNNSIYQSVLNDKTTSFRNALTESVSRGLLGVLQNSGDRKVVSLHFDLNVEENLKLQQSFPEFQLVFNSCVTHPHAFSAAHRVLEYNRLLAKVGYNKVRSLSSNSIQLIDIGGDYAKNVITGNFGIHADCPLLDSRDYSRETNRQQRVNDYFSDNTFMPGSLQIKFLRDYNETTNLGSANEFFCYSKFEDCKVTADKAIMLHSCYDIQFSTFAKAMYARGVKVLYGTFNFSPEILYLKDGVNSDLGYTWHVDLHDDTICFGFKNDSSWKYVHNLTNYLSWATQAVMIDYDNDAVYLKEMMENINGVQFFKISYAGPIVNTNIKSDIYFPSVKEKVLVTVFDFDFDAVAKSKYDRMLTESQLDNLPADSLAVFNPDQMLTFIGNNDHGMKRKTILVDKNFMNELLLFVLGANESKFVPLEVFNMARSLIMRIVVGKEVVRAYKSIDARELFMLAQTIYILCYALKWSQGKVTQQLKAAIEYDRTLYHNNWFIKLLKCIPFCSSKPQVVPHRNFLTGWFHKLAYGYRKSAFSVGDMIKDVLEYVEIDTNVFTDNCSKLTVVQKGKISYTDMLVDKVVPSAPRLEDMEDIPGELYKYYDTISTFPEDVYNKVVVDYKTDRGKISDCRNNSYYKLMEIDKKFFVLPMDTTSVVLDVSVAPGGFVKLCNERNILVDGNVYLGKNSISLYNGVRFNNVTTSNGDITDVKVMDNFKYRFYACVLCDASVNVDGRGEINNYNVLVSEVALIKRCASIGASAVLKIFIPETDVVKSLLVDLASYFEFSDVYRCFNTSKISSELYLVLKGYRAVPGPSILDISSFDSYKSALEYNLCSFIKDMHILTEVVQTSGVELCNVVAVDCVNTCVEEDVSELYAESIESELELAILSEDKISNENPVPNAIVDGYNLTIVSEDEVSNENIVLDAVVNSENTKESCGDDIDGTVAILMDTMLEAVGAAECLIGECARKTDVVPGDVCLIQNEDRISSRVFMGSEEKILPEDYGYDLVYAKAAGDGHCFFNALLMNGDGKSFREALKCDKAPPELNNDEYVGEETFVYMISNFNIGIHVHIFDCEDQYINTDSYLNPDCNQIFHLVYKPSHYDFCYMICRCCGKYKNSSGFLWENFDVDYVIDQCDCVDISVPMICSKRSVDYDRLNSYLSDNDCLVNVYFGKEFLCVKPGVVSFVSPLIMEDHVCRGDGEGFRLFSEGIYVNCCKREVMIVRGSRQCPTLNFVEEKQSTQFDGFSISVKDDVYTIALSSDVNYDQFFEFLEKNLTCSEINVKSNVIFEYSWLTSRMNISRVNLDVKVNKKYFNYDGSGNFIQNCRAAITEQVCDWGMTRSKISDELNAVAIKTRSYVGDNYGLESLNTLFNDTSLGVVVATKISNVFRCQFVHKPITLFDSYAMVFATDKRNSYGLKSVKLNLKDKNGIQITGLDVPVNSVFLYFNKDCRMDNSLSLYNAVCPLISSPVRFNLEVFEGAPGIGKTSLVLTKHDFNRDIILTATRLGAEEIRTRSLAKNVKDGLTEEIAKSIYMTIDAYLLNGTAKCKVLYVDEALMVHAGSWLAAGVKSQCEKIVIIGDSAQIPYIDRNGFDVKLHHYRTLGSNTVVHTKLNSFRIPCDVALFINTLRENGKPLYTGKVTTSNTVRKSLVAIVDTSIYSSVKNLCTDRVVLTFSQADKAELHKLGIFANTIGESQGSQHPNIVLVRLNAKDLPLYSNVNQWLVGVSRHTKSFTYVTPVMDGLAKHINTVNSMSEAELMSCFVMTAGATPQYPSYSVQIKPCAMKNPLTYPKVIRDFVCAHNSTGLQSMIPEMVDAGLDVPLDVPFVPLWNVSDPINTIQFYVDKIRPGSSCEYQRYDQYNYNYRNQIYSAFECSRFPMPSVPKIRDYLTPSVRVVCPVSTVHNDRSIVKAFSERNGGVPEYTTQTRDDDLSDELIENFVNNCVSDKALLNTYKDNPIELNSVSVQNWLYTQPPSTVDCLEDEQYYNIFFRELNQYNYILKKVPKPDLEANGHLKFPAPQAIAHQPKQVNAYFCSMLRECKQRLLAVLKPNIIINSDLAPSDLLKLLDHRIPTKQFVGVGGKLLCKRVWQRFLELDISKYDKSQQRVMLLSEVKFFILMGMCFLFIVLWVFMHVFTCLKDMFTKFKAFVVYQRKSGDAWTFSGNTIFLILIIVFVLVVYFCVDIDTIILLAAGDDSCVFLKELLDKIKFYQLFGNLFNLEVKVLDYSVPYFCSKFFIPTEFGWLIIPDLWKLVIKLGRKDLVGFEHVKQYQISLQDIIQPLRNALYLPYVSIAMCDRYKLDIGVEQLVAAIVTIIDGDFESMYYLHDNDYLEKCSTLPSLDI